jgi:uncharacterized protein (DUF885 family)
MPLITRSLSARPIRALAIVALSAGLVPDPALAQTAATAQKQIDQLVEETAAHLRTTPYSFVATTAWRSGGPIQRVVYADAQKEAEFHERMLDRLNTVDLTGAPHKLQLEAFVLRKVYEYGRFTDHDYWLEFAVTPYTGGQNFVSANRTLDTHLFKKDSDLDEYLERLDAYADLLEQVATKTREQAARGIRVARPGIKGVLATFQGLRKEALRMVPGPERLAGLPPERVSGFTESARKRVVERIQPACDAVVAIFDEDYVRLAPEKVGLRQYPGGKERYERMLAYNGYGMSPQEIHERARRDVDQIWRELKAVRDKLGFKGSAGEFHAMLRKHPQLVFHTPAQLEKRYSYFLERIEKHILDYFWERPRQPYGFKPLDPALDNGTRGGGGQGPSPADPIHRYVYPAFDLANRSLEVGAAHRIYHELVPGHYFQGTLLRENPSSDNLRKLNVRFSAYAEGWANYGASLAIEMGIMDDPYDLYLELLAQANGASRSVIDTGMNYMGMSLADARTYLREHSPIMSDVAVEGESLRFGADNFGQSVSYWMGFVKIWEARRRAQQALGPRFNLRDFHAVVLNWGSLPMDALDKHVDWYIEDPSRARALRR